LVRVIWETIESISCSDRERQENYKIRLIRVRHFVGGPGVLVGLACRRAWRVSGPGSCTGLGESWRAKEPLRVVARRAASRCFVSPRAVFPTTGKAHKEMYSRYWFFTNQNGEIPREARLKNLRQEGTLVGLPGARSWRVLTGVSARRLIGIAICSARACCFNHISKNKH
jgi:hypothetical protein